MIAFPNCKINLGLNVTRKREDGYHDIETAFYPVDFTDVLEIISCQDDENQFTVTGLPVGDIKDNLCNKAYALLKNDHPRLPSVKMHLHKAIPSGAGLGGGSADAAFTLQLLSEKFLPGLTFSQLNSYAFQLGSDCPFFLHNKPCLATGRGENLSPVEITLSSYKIVLINPAIHIDTAWAFANIKPSAPTKSINEIVVQPITTWRNELVNAFEAPVFNQYPEIAEVKNSLYNSGALYASLSGSGSTVYGIFDSMVNIDLNFPTSYLKQIINLK